VRLKGWRASNDVNRDAGRVSSQAKCAATPAPHEFFWVPMSRIQSGQALRRLLSAAAVAAPS